MKIDDLIKKRLDELCPQLFLDGFDKVVWQFCKQDMLAYLNFLKRYKQTFDNEISHEQVIRYAEIFYFGHIFFEGSLSSVYNLHIMAQQYDAEFKEWANMWIGQWWRKFNQRVKLAFKKPKHLAIEKMMKKGTTRWESLSRKEKNYIMDRAIKTLLSNGEIVCPQIIAMNMIARRLGTRKLNTKKKWKFEDTVDLGKTISSVLKTLSYTHEPLMFIFPTKEAFMSEWRGESNSNIVS